LYEEFGAHCVQQLRGEFAFVLWDEANRTLFAARDRFGIRYSAPLSASARWMCEFNRTFKSRIASKPPGRNLKGVFD
jgi:hypothetical protein